MTQPRLTVAATLLATAAPLASPLAAETPRVLTDIPPVQSIVANVLGRTPEVILADRRDPHVFALRPSEGRALAGADVFVWVGEEMTPPLANALDTLPGDAIVLTLLEIPGTRILEVDEDGHDDHGEDGDHDDHGHAEEASVEDDHV
ncbi:MAG: metal ABC transporter solute-binding protein, Zn/Mn family, partial [Shimia sp.]